MNRRYLLLFVASLLAPAALAHGVEGSSFSDGFLHPVLGFDHLLAMVAVGLLSTQMGGRAIWSVPFTFVTIVVLSMILGLGKHDFAYLELGILLSVVALGLVIAIGRGLRLPVAFGVVSFFALFHGYAHGLEMPFVANPWIFAGGMVLGTALLHLAGVAIGAGAKRFGSRGESLLRHVGSALFGIGLYMLLTKSFELPL